MSFFSKLIASIGSFLSHLIKGAANGFEAMSPEDQKSVLNGVNVSQIIKQGYSKGEAFVIDEIVKETGVSTDVANGLVLQVAKDAGINATSVQGALNGFADKIDSGLTDIAHSALFQLIAQSAATFLSGGSINWITLALGVIEYAFQFLKSKNKLVTLATQCPSGSHWDSEASACVKDSPGSTNPPTP